MALGQGEIGQRIKQARKEAGFTQVEFARLIGVQNPQSVSNYERGVNEVPSPRMRQIAEVTGKPLSFFFAPGEEPQDGVRLKAETELGLLRADIADLAQVVATIAAAQKKLAGDLGELRRESGASRKQATKRP